MLSKPHNVLLSGDVNVSTTSIFKQKSCNDFGLKSKECFLTTILLTDNEAAEDGQLYKVNGCLLVPLQLFVRYLIGFQELISVLNPTHVFVVVRNASGLGVVLISVSPVWSVHH